MKSESIFKVGDVVRLKSIITPVMVIKKFTWDSETEANFTDRVDCIWIADNKLYRESLYTITLMIYN